LLAASPRVLSLGEAHAQKGTEELPTTARRFGLELLPLLRGKATDLIIELPVAPQEACEAPKQQAAETTREVTSTQSSFNQEDYLWLGRRAKKLGIEPHALPLTCADLERAAAAGDGQLDVMLSLIADKTAELAKELLERRGPDALIVTYGGLIHNDVAPREGREPWSFGPRMKALTGARYVAVDLIVREFIRHDELWSALPWVQGFDATRFPRSALVLSPPGADEVLVLPRTPESELKRTPDVTPATSVESPSTSTPTP